MPVYEFKCEKCGEKFEKLMTVSNNNSVPECIGCGSSNVKKIFSVFGFSSGGRSVSSSGSSCGTCSSNSCSTCSA